MCEFGGTDAGGYLRTTGKVYFWQTRLIYKWTDQCGLAKCREGVETLSRVRVRQSNINDIPKVMDNGECSKDLGSTHGIHVHVKPAEEYQDCSVTGPHFMPNEKDHTLTSFTSVN